MPSKQNIAVLAQRMHKKKGKKNRNSLIRTVIQMAGCLICSVFHQEKEYKAPIPYCRQNFIIMAILPFISGRR